MSICVFILFGLFHADGASGTFKVTQLNDTLPAVFEIGEYSDEYEKTIAQYPTLLQACHDDVYLAYDKWLYMLNEIESLALSYGVSLKGARLYLSVVWNANGTIRHIAYYPKSDSQILHKESIQNLLEQFVKSFKLPITSNQPITNYGSASFPIPVRKQIASKN